MADQNWYAERSAQLGRRFRRALDRAVFGVAQHPLGCPVVCRDRLRRALVLDRCPYALHFTARDDQVMAVACFPEPAATGGVGRSAREQLFDSNLAVSA
jgi:hypothetical protein